MNIVVDDLSGPQIVDFLHEHVQQMRSITPLDSAHALDLDELRKPGVTFWSVRDGGTVVGCAAIKRLDAVHAELKSMRTAVGLQRAMLAVECHLDAAAVDHRRHRRWVQVGAGDHEWRRGVPVLERPGGLERVDDGHAQAAPGLKDPGDLGHGLRHLVNVVKRHVRHGKVERAIGERQLGRVGHNR
jgi:hypothetical protein